MESLDISRESVYRRIRGDISFTLEEIAKLSVDLGFSIDELIVEDMRSRVFFDLNINPSQNPAETFEVAFRQYFDPIFETPHVKNIESVMILNHVPLGFIIFFEHLFKFTYYRWMHQNQESSLKYFYSDVVLPDSLILLKQRAMENLKKIRSSTLILDSNVFLYLCREVQYFYKRRLLNEDEFFLLRDELLKLVDTVENMAQSGCLSTDTKYSIYLSALHIESSSRYIKLDDQTKSQFFANSLIPMTVTNSNLCAVHKKWLDSMLKYATLITQSNEILQVKHFNKQRSYVDQITDNMLIISL
jgi:hypothetical protein